MIGKILFAAGLALIAAPAAQAQEGGAIDPMTWGQVATMQGTTDVMTNCINNNTCSGGNGGARSRQPVSDRARAYCANRAETRARLGADDYRVKRLYELCAQAGL